MQYPADLAVRVTGEHEQRVKLARVFNPYFQIESLYRFNAKFGPRWEPRFLVFQRTRRLPRVGLAAMWIEGQLRKPAIR